MIYSYDLYDNKLNRIEGKRISAEKYNEVIAKFNPGSKCDEWETEYKDSILYAKLFKIDGYDLFMWKEVNK